MRSVTVVLLAGPALAYPIWYALKFPAESPPGQNDAAFGYIELPIAMEAGHDYLPRMHYSNRPERYYHIRDWYTAVRNTASPYATGDYTHLAALSRHYPFVQSVESQEFLAKHNRFLVWNEPDQKWFDWRILTDSNYAVRLLGRDQGIQGHWNSTLWKRSMLPGMLLGPIETPGSACPNRVQFYFADHSAARLRDRIGTMSLLRLRRSLRGKAAWQRGNCTAVRIDAIRASTNPRKSMILASERLCRSRSTRPASISHRQFLLAQRKLFCRC